MCHIKVYKGILACFFHGFALFLLAKISKSLQICLRVVLGSIISSTKPEMRSNRFCDSIGMAISVPENKG